MNQYLLFALFFVIGLVICFVFAFITKQYVNTFFLFGIKNLMSPDSDLRQNIERFISGLSLNEYFIFYVVLFLILVAIRML